ncbi:helix-turn-helix transcriptional regulator [Legionella sainthelensi]|uniref:helix-turn-helix transcriptional regulator n=1 Tax=Legionella sainthelensi TaxID=28087 RepID=UPI000E1FD28B|nr:LuxR family transcriptional regulator [Legionella sainthelensi]
MMQSIKKRMAEVKSIDELNTLLKNYFWSISIKSFAFTYYNQHTKTGSKLVYEWATPPLDAWHKYYLQEGYADIDRTLESTEQSLLPIFWDVKEQFRLAKNKRMRRFKEESLLFGLDKGLCIPLHGPKGEFVILVLHQRINEQGLTNWENHVDAWIGILHTYFHFLRLLLNEKNIGVVPLTKREQECLRLTAEGFRLEMIAQLLKISKRTVNFHLQNANKKLGVTNKYLAIMALWNHDPGINLNQPNKI